MAKYISNFYFKPLAGEIESKDEKIATDEQELKELTGEAEEKVEEGEEGCDE
jgi:F0F1-type ATP synthase membrane subunit b/b'